MKPSLGPLLQSFLTDHLPIQKGLRIGSIRSYRDTIRLFLAFVAQNKRRSMTSLSLEDLTFDRVLSFLKHLEQNRHNCIRTRNQRRAALNTFFAYLALRAPEMLATCQQVAAIPVKRTSQAITHYLEREEVTALLRSMPREGHFALRDRTLILFLYNTAATHLLESGVEVNVIRGWLGHVSLDTTNRYAELTLQRKSEALRACELDSRTSAVPRPHAVWKDDKTLLTWLKSL